MERKAKDGVPARRRQQALASSTSAASAARLQPRAGPQAAPRLTSRVMPARVKSVYKLTLGSAWRRQPLLRPRAVAPSRAKHSSTSSHAVEETAAATGQRRGPHRARRLRQLRAADDRVGYGARNSTAGRQAGSARFGWRAAYRSGSSSFWYPKTLLLRLVPCGEAQQQGERPAGEV